MSEIITAKDIYKTFQTSSGEVHALNGINLILEKGLFYAIIGKSGSGKSTLLHILSGLDRPTAGNVLIDGKDLFSCSDEKMAIFRRRQMGFVFQQFNLLEEYNIKTNIEMPLKLDGKKVDSDFLQQITDMLGISEKMEKYPSELSGGEQQRVAIARSLIAKPKIIFADEPTGNLDKKSGEDTMRLLKMCARQFGQTLVMVTHDLDIARTADKVIQIEDGKVVTMT